MSSDENLSPLKHFYLSLYFLNRDEEHNTSLQICHLFHHNTSEVHTKKEAVFYLDKSLCSPSKWKCCICHMSCHSWPAEYKCTEVVLLMSKISDILIADFHSTICFRLIVQQCLPLHVKTSGNPAATYWTVWHLLSWNILFSVVRNLCSTAEGLLI